MKLQRIIATFVKERILLLRDWPGLLMLLGMPVLLIITMAVIQDVPFKDYQDVSFKLVWADDDGKALSDSLKALFKDSGQFDLTDTIDGMPVTGRQARRLVTEGRFPVGVVVTKGSYSEMVNKTNKIVNIIGQSSGNPAIIPVRPANDSLKVVLLFDPVAKNTFKMAVQNALEKMLFKVQFDLLFRKIGPGDDPARPIRIESDELLADKILLENLGRLKKESLVMNSVQHNVPAWIVFAIFFLIIPLSGNYIKEKGEGSRIRVAMTPGRYLDIIIGKVSFYTLFGLFQFSFLLLISKLCLPAFGLPALEFGQQWWAAFVAAGSITFAAISWGIVIGSYFETYHQAMMFSAITIILLSAIGGIWIPIEVLPQWLQQLAMASPLQWSLSLFQDVFLRGIHWKGFALKMGLLTAFGLICLLLAAYFHKRTK